MKLFNRNKNTELTNRSTYENYNPILGFLGFGGGSGGANSNYSGSKAQKLAVVFRCLSIISDSVASLPILPYTKLNNAGIVGDWKYVDYSDNSNLYNLLNVAPNAFQSSFMFKKRIVMDMLTKGNFYCYIDRLPSGKIQSLTALNPGYIQIEIINNDITYLDNSTGNRYEKESIIHIKNQEIDNSLYGVSTLTFASLALGLSYAGDEFAMNWFTGGGAAAGILSPIAGVNVNDSKAKAAKDAWTKALSNETGKPNSIIVLDSGMNYQKLGASPAETQLLESRKFQISQIAMFFGVPNSILTNDGAKFSTSEQEFLSFLSLCLQPILEKIESEFIMRIYMPSELQYSTLKFNTENLLRVDTVATADYYSKLFMCGAFSVNEITQKVNAESVPVSGGNRKFVPVNLQPIDALISEQTIVADPTKILDNKLKSKKEIVK